MSPVSAALAARVARSPLPSDLQARLACPTCQSALAGQREALRCLACGSTYPIEGGVLRAVPSDVAGQDLACEARQRLSYEERRFARSWLARRRNLRERAIVRWFLDGLAPGSWVLDVPSGMGRFSDLVLERGHSLCSVDLDPVQVEAARARRGAQPSLSVQADVTRLPLQDGAMDAVLCVRLSQYFAPEALPALLRELGRVAEEVLLSYRDAASLAALWKRGIGRWSGRRQGFTYRVRRAELEQAAGGAGLELLGPSPHSNGLHHVNFVRLKRA